MWKSNRQSPSSGFARERNLMVESQIADRGVADKRVLAAMRRVPRHEFVPADMCAYAYADHPVQIGYGQTISQPYMVAAMTELLTLQPDDHVLEVGTGSGYQAAILAELSADVVSIERNEHLAERARACLERLGCTNVAVVVGDGTLGYPPSAPYDAILVTAGGPHVPPALKEQLAVGGRLICPIGPRDIQHLAKIVRTPTGFIEEQGMSCVFVPLVGDEGWSP